MLERNKLWNKANSDKTVAAYKRWYDKYGIAYHQQWRDDNRAAVNASAARWREAHPNYQPQWAKEHREQRNASWHRYNARKIGATMEPVDVMAIYDLYERTCIYCGTKDNLTLDHVAPLNGGGAHREDNLVVACLSCNSSKRDKPLAAWLQMQPQAQAWVM